MDMWRMNFGEYSKLLNVYLSFLNLLQVDVFTWLKLVNPESLEIPSLRLVPLNCFK